MKKTFTSSRLYAAALSSMLGLSAFGADCVVNYTNFDTYNQLCNPDLTDDLEGWYNDSIRNGACKGPKETTIDSVKQGGMLRAKIQTSGNITFEEYVDLYSGSIASHGRYTDVVAEPRTLSPYFMETESKNMIVTAGSISDDFVFMTYKVENLVPGSNVTLTFDAYNLLSSEKMENYLIELSQNSKEPVTRLNFGGLTFQMLTIGYTLDKGTGMIMGNRASLSVSTDMSQGVVPSGDRISTSSNFDYGTKVNLTLSSKADANGEICFYFSTQAGSYSPIGIDNIKIEGEAQPKIKCSKRLPVCNGSAVSFDIPSILDNEGITYSWSNGKEVATTKEFTPSLDEADKLYTVKCTIKSTECSATSSIEVPTKLCCMTADGKPLGIIDVFFDDFGEFSADGTEYTYISNGKKITVPTTGIYGAGDPKRCVNALQEGASVPYITPCSKNSGLSDAWAISNVNPYNPGVLSDASGDPMGGMLIVDLSGDKVNGTPLKDLVIYRHVASGNLKGKEITAGCNLGTINYAAERDQAILKVIIRNETDTIFSQEVNLKGDEGWLNIEHNFVSPSDSLTFEIRNETYTYVTSQGDFAIDNVFMSYCDEPKAPALPSIKIGYNTNAKSIVNLCKDDELEFNVKISESAESNFEDLQYMLQYSRDYINWNTISRIQSDKSFVVDEGINPCFDDTLIGKIVYFRIVAADYASLIGFDSGNLSSDKVSISDFAIVASDPKCDYSDTIPSDTTPVVSECTTPDGTPIPMVNIFYDDFGEFSEDGTKYKYTDADGIKHTVPVEKETYTEGKGTIPAYYELPQGITTPDIPSVHHIWEGGWIISYTNPFVKGIQFDASNTNYGGMMLMDLSGYGNLTVYKRVVKGNLKDKNFEFGCSVGAINKSIDGKPVVTLRAIVRSGNDTLYTEKKELMGDDSWYDLFGRFTSPSDSLIVEIKTTDENLTGTGKGDFAIDNVFMSYCEAIEDTTHTPVDTIPNDTTIIPDECIAPDGTPIPVVTLFHDDFGEFSADGTKYTYKNSDGNKVEENCGISIYGNPYTHTLQDGVTVGEKAVTAIYEGGWMISNYNQYKVGIDSDCSENPNGGMLIMDLAGTNYANKAIYSHKTKGNIKDKNVRFECSVGAINFLENTPVIRLKAIVRADNDTLVSSDVVSLYGTEGWQKIDLSFISNSDSLIAEIIVIDDNLTGVNRGDFAIDNVLMKYCDTENTSTPSIADRTNVFDASDVVRSEYFNFVGQKVNGNVKGLVIERILLKNGNIITRKIMRE